MPSVSLCPSFRCTAGSYLIGVIDHDGSVAFSGDHIEIDEEFVQIARKGRRPEARFRFANTCVESGCGRWTGEACEVVDALVAASRLTTGALPVCSIRQECRWWSQRGAAACRVCAHVATELMEAT
jgi:hypothetical protein